MDGHASSLCLTPVVTRGSLFMATQRVEDLYHHYLDEFKSRTLLKINLGFQVMTIYFDFVERRNDVRIERQKRTSKMVYSKNPRIRTYNFASQPGFLNNEYNGLVLIKW